MAERATGAVRGALRIRPVHRSALRDGDPVNGAAPLRRSVDVRATIRAGAKAGGPGAVVHARRRQDDEASRGTVVAGRRIGNAVARNRAKRRLRAAMRETVLAPGFDVVVVAHHGALTADYPTLRRTLAGSIEGALARAEDSR